MSRDEILMIAAAKIPNILRKNILAEGFIDKATNSDQTGKPMEFLFDVFEEYLDPAGEHDDWNCFKCRAYVLQYWRNLKPYLIKLNV